MLVKKVGLPSLDMRHIEGAVVHLDRKDRLISEGPLHPYIYLVRAGSLRVSAHFEEDEHVVDFYTAGQVMALPATLKSSWLGPEQVRATEVVTQLDRYRSGPSPFRVTALEPVTALRLDMASVEAAVEESPAWAMVALHLLMLSSALLEDRITGLLTVAPQVRYQEFVTDRGELEATVPARDIASYLGIAPATLSRIRRRLRADAGVRA